MSPGCGFIPPRKRWVCFFAESLVSKDDSAVEERDGLVGGWGCGGRGDGGFQVSEAWVGITASSACPVASGVVFPRLWSTACALLLLFIVAVGPSAHGQARTASNPAVGLIPDATSLNGPGNVFLTATVSGTGGTGTVSLTVADLNNDGKRGSCRPTIQFCFSFLALTFGPHSASAYHSQA
jgi:hypothetical protein